MITTKQRQARNQGVGASECAAILGLDEYRTAYDLWVLKSELHEVSGEPAETEAQEIGNEIEVTTARLAAKRLNCRLVKPTATYKAANGIMFANLDRQVERSVRGADNCELKSTGFVEGWGDEGTDQVPKRVLVQVTAQMLCSDARVSHVARLLGRWGFSFAMYRVDYSAPLAAVIEERTLQFWECVDKGVPPSNSLPSLDVVTHLKRTPGKVVQIDGACLAAFKAANEARKQAEKNEEQAKANLLAALGDAEVGEGGGLKASFKTINTTRFDVKALEAAEPATYAKYLKASGYRKLDVRECK